MQPESILMKAYELIKFLLPVLRSFPKEQRFLLGDRIQNLASDAFELLIEAFYTPGGPEKLQKLRAVNIKLEKLRFFIRLCYESGFFTSTRWADIARHVDEVGRMTGGWIKSLEKKAPPN